MNSVIESISSYTDIVRLQISKKPSNNKAELEQYFSNSHLAALMASMMNYDGEEISILDPGAGVGSLFVACIDEIIHQGLHPKKITVTAYEIDESLFVYLYDSLEQCRRLCKKNGIRFSSRLIKKDFVADTILNLEGKDVEKFSHIIINPPYKKINTISKLYQRLNKSDLESTNMYAVFVMLSEKILKDTGEMAFISPRSFCNGRYFQSFRKKFLESMVIKRIHLFDSRSLSFSDDNVLQENVIVHAVKTRKIIPSVLISSNSSPDDQNITIKQVQSNSVIHHDDPQQFIHIISDEIDAQISNKITQLKSTLKDLNIDVSTGKVIDFRIKKALRHKQNDCTVPLIRPFNLSKGSIKFPISNKKENHIENTSQSQHLLVKNGNYILVKRFTTKEERKRIVASMWHGTDFDFSLVGFENKVNYFHSEGNSLDVDVAKGLALFLNSTIVDAYFRQFNGNTQVNATDLRYIRYPTCTQLKTLGSLIKHGHAEQKEIDDLIEKVVFGMNKKTDKIDPILAKRKIDEAITILKCLDFPRQQQNDRSGLTLLSLLDLKHDHSWKKSRKHMVGIASMMNFFEKNYGKKYAPNSREMVLKQTIHQFIQAGLVVENPDKPDRPTNSGKTAYQMNGHALKIIQSFNTPSWNKNLSEYKKMRPSLQQKYQNKRKMEKISLTLPSKKMLEISP